jgi:hypothetical protein
MGGTGLEPVTPSLSSRGLSPLSFAASPRRVDCTKRVAARLRLAAECLEQERVGVDPAQVLSSLPGAVRLELSRERRPQRVRTGACAEPSRPKRGSPGASPSHPASAVSRALPLGPGVIFRSVRRGTNQGLI